MHHTLRHTLALVVFALVAIARTASAQIQLFNGEAATGLNAASGNEIHFVLAVPADATQVVIETAGDDPDADIYLRWGAPASTTAWAYKADGPSSDEAITVNNPPGGNLYIMVRAQTAFTGLALIGEYFGAGDIYVEELVNGDDVSNLDGFTGDDFYFKISVPFGQDYLSVKLVGADPDADLYLRWGDLPFTDEWHAKSNTTTSNESIIIGAPPAGDIYILVHAFSTFYNATLSVDWDGPDGDGATELENGTATPKFGGAEDSFRLFAIEIPEETSYVSFTTYGGSGDADLYLRWDDIPSLDEFDDADAGAGNSHEIALAWPEPGTAYLLVHGAETYNNIRVKVTFNAWNHVSHVVGPWKNQKIGTSSKKIKNDGSFLAALSMAFNYAGVEADPSTLNAWLKSHSGYKDQWVVKWGTAAKYDGSDGVDFVNSSSITTMAKLRQLLDQGRIVIARSDRYDNDTHWVVIRYYTGSGNTWSKFHYWDPADTTAIDRVLGDGWVGEGSATRVYEINE